MLTGTLRGGIDGCSTRGFEDLPSHLLALIRFGDIDPDPRDRLDDLDVIGMCD